MAQKNVKDRKAGKTKTITDANRKTRNSQAAAHKKRPTRNTTTHKLVWRHVTARVRDTRNYINTGWSHIELIVTAPKDAPVPITSTGYLSHFLDERELAKAGGPVRFFLDWMDREASSKAWAKTEAKWRQLELF